MPIAFDGGPLNFVHNFTGDLSTLSRPIRPTQVRNCLTLNKFTSWRPRVLRFTDEDTLRIRSPHDLILTLWPFVHDIPIPALVSAVAAQGNL